MEIKWEVVTAIATAFSAFGTILVTIISLYLARKSKKIDVYITQTEVYLYDKGIIGLTLTINNLGDIPIIITTCGEVKNRKILDLTTNKYLKSDFQPLLVKPDDAKIIEYEYKLEKTFTEEELFNKQVFNPFANKIFGVRDTLNNTYMCGNNKFK